MNARYRRSGGSEQRTPTPPGASSRKTKREKQDVGGRGSSLRLALKIAARTSIRSVGRSALIALMVALPVAGLTTAAVVYNSTQPTVADRLTSELGRTEAMLRLMSPGVPLSQHPTHPAQWTGLQGEGVDPGLEVSELLPAGTRIFSQSHLSITAETEAGVAAFEATEGESWHESLAGRFVIAEGRSPRNDREAMVTAATLSHLGVELGGTVRVTAPERASVTIVGVLDAQIWADSTEHFFIREGALGDFPEEERYLGASYYLPETELNWAAVERLNEQGATVLSRAVLLDPPPPGTGFDGYGNGAFGAILVLVLIIGAFAAFEVILLAGAAFTVTARQQQRSLATMTSVGATRRTLFQVLTANGLVLGTIGGVAGIALGIAGAAAFMMITANGSTTQYYGFHVPWLWLLAIAAYAILIGWVSSLLPARTAIKFDVVAALRGSKRPPAERKRTPVEGVIMLGIGVALTLAGGVLLAILNEAGRNTSGGHPLMWVPTVMLMVGPILAQMGLIRCGPLLMRGAARLFSGISLGARLGARDAARNPGRSVPAVAAIMTTVFVAVVGMNLAGSAQQSQMNNFNYGRMPGQVEVALSSIDWGDGLNVKRVAYGSSDPVAATLRSELDVDTLRVLSSVQEPIPGVVPDEQGESSTLYPAPRPPRENLCPWDSDSPDNKGLDAASNDFMDDPRCSGSFAPMTGFKDHLWVGDVRDLALVLGREPSTAAQEMLKNGGAVSLPAEYVHDSTVDIAWLTADQVGLADGRYDSKVRTETLPAVVDPPGLRGIYFGVFISPETADTLGIEYRESTVLASLNSPPTTTQTDAVNAALAALQPTRHSGLDLMRTEVPNFAELWAWGLLLLGGLIAVASSAVAIGLARFDGRQDDATLASIGAGRMLRRSFAFWQALLLAGLGTVLGAGMGMIPALGLSANPDLPFNAPWLQIGVTVVVLPLVIACGSWLFATRSKVSARRMAIS